MPLAQPGLLALSRLVGQRLHIEEFAEPRSFEEVTLTNTPHHCRQERNLQCSGLESRNTSHKHRDIVQHAVSHACRELALDGCFTSHLSDCQQYPKCSTVQLTRPTKCIRPPRVTGRMKSGSRTVRSKNHNAPPFSSPGTGNAVMALMSLNAQ